MQKDLNYQEYQNCYNEELILKYETKLLEAFNNNLLDGEEISFKFIKICARNFIFSEELMGLLFVTVQSAKRRKLMLNGISSHPLFIKALYEYKKLLKNDVVEKAIYEYFRALYEAEDSISDTYACYEFFFHFYNAYENAISNVKHLLEENASRTLKQVSF